MPSQHLSIRLPKETYSLLEAQSRRSNRTRSETAKTLIEEGLRMLTHPGVIFRDGPAGRRPGLVNGPDIWEVARVFAGSFNDLAAMVERAQRLTGLSEQQIRTALRYYTDYSSEIDAWLALVDEEADELEARARREQERLRPAG